MPSSAVKRKLRSANNAWKGLTNLLRSKLFLLKRSKAFKRTATAISTVLGRRRHRRRFRLKNRSLPRLPSDPAAGCNRTKIQRQRRRAVYVDDLFARPASTPVGIMVDVQPAAFVGKVPADVAAAPPEEAAGGPVEASASHIGSSPTVVDNMVCWIGSNRCDSSESERIMGFPIRPIPCESDQFSSVSHANQFDFPESGRIRKNLNRPILSMRRNLVDNGSSLQLGLGKTSPGDLIGGREGRGEGSSSSSSGIHQLEGVDLRAELFIAKFREEMRRQK